ncbi:hypothetical protein [Arthrobacter cheniae]|nr:hypothetical protein [Arthrobacter cheniae]
MTHSAAHTRSPDPDGTGPEAPYASKGKLDRIVGLVIVGLVTAAAALLWVAVAANGPDSTITEPNDAVIGLWSVLYSSDAPEVSIILAAIALALLAGTGLALVERRITTTSRRSMNPGHQPPKSSWAPTMAGSQAR